MSKLLSHLQILYCLVKPPSFKSGDKTISLQIVDICIDLIDYEIALTIKSFR